MGRDVGIHITKILGFGFCFCSFVPSSIQLIKTQFLLGIRPLGAGIELNAVKRSAGELDASKAKT